MNYCVSSFAHDSGYNENKTIEGKLLTFFPFSVNPQTEVSLLIKQSNFIIKEFLWDQCTIPNLLCALNTEKCLVRAHLKSATL